MCSLCSLPTLTPHLIPLSSTLSLHPHYHQSTPSPQKKTHKLSLRDLCDPSALDPTEVCTESLEKRILLSHGIQHMKFWTVTIMQPFPHVTPLKNKPATQQCIVFSQQLFMWQSYSPAPCQGSESILVRFYHMLQWRVCSDVKWRVEGVRWRVEWRVDGVRWRVEDVG